MKPLVDFRPLLLEWVLLAILIPFQEATLQAALSKASLGQNIAIHLGDSITLDSPAPGAGSIDTPGQIDNYSFSASANQAIFLDFTRLDGPQVNWLRWQILNPDASPLAENWVTLDSGRLTLPSSGTYQIRLFAHSSNPTAIGEYDFTLRDVSQTDTFTIHLGDDIAQNQPAPGAGALETPGQIDTYTFAAIANQVVFLDITDLQGPESNWLRWRIDQPDGSPLSENWITIDSPRLTLPTSGTYRLHFFAHNDNRDATATYAFTLYDVTQTDTFTIHLGDDIAQNQPAPGAGALETPGQIDTYTFAAIANQVVFLDITDLQGPESNWIRWRIDLPEGTPLSENWITVDSPRLTLPTSGTYRLHFFAHNDNRDATATYAFTLYDVSTTDTFNIVPGDTLTQNQPALGAGSIESPGQIDTYFFEANVNQTLFVDVKNIQGPEANWLRWKIVQPDGSTLAENWITSDSTRLTLTLTGTYTLSIFAHPDNPDATGLYTLTLVDIPNQEPFALPLNSIISENQPAPGAGRILIPGEIDLFTLDLQAGQILFFDSLANASTIRWEFLGPDNALIAEAWLSQDLGLIPIPTTGTYSLRVLAHSSLLDALGPYSFIVETRETYGLPIGYANNQAHPSTSTNGSGVDLQIFLEQSGNQIPVPDLFQNLIPNATFHADLIDFPNPNSTVGVGQPLSDFFASSATPPPSIAPLPSGQFLLRSSFWLKVTSDLDIFPESPEIDLDLAVYSDDGFHLSTPNQTLAQAGARGFSPTWTKLSFEQEGLYPFTLLYAANNSVSSGLELAWITRQNPNSTAIPTSRLFDQPQNQTPQLITFDTIPPNTFLTQQYESQGLRIRPLKGQLGTRLASDLQLAATSGISVFSALPGNDSERLEWEWLFNDPLSLLPGVADNIQFTLITPTQVLVEAYSINNDLLFSQSFGDGSQSTLNVRIDRTQIARIRLTTTPSQLQAIDDLQFLNPRAFGGNLPPTFASLSNPSISEGSHLEFQLEASDPNQPTQSLTYRLGANAPEGLTLNPVTGLLTWTPTERQGPGIYEITVQVYDSFPTPGSDETSFLIFVDEVNQPPTLAGPQSIFFNGKTPLSVRFSMRDPDFPSQSHRFSMSGNIPPGATFNSETFLWTWTPPLTGFASQYSFTLTVTETETQGHSPLSASLPITVIHDANGPFLLNLTPSGSIGHPVDFLQFTFDEPILPQSLSLSSFQITGPNGPVPILYLESVSPHSFEVHLATPLGLGTYEILMLPEMTDLAGNPLDQNGDGVGGDFLLDLIVDSLTIGFPDLQVSQLTPPDSLIVGEDNAFSWHVTNLGTQTAQAPWTESLYWIDSQNQLRWIASIPVLENLSPSQTLTRNAIIPLPANLPAGPIQFQLVVDSDHQVTELQESNNQLDPAPLANIPASLTLILPTESIRENTSSPTFQARLTRNTSTAPLTVSLESSQPDELTLPASILLPTGISSLAIPMTVRPDGIFDGPQTVLITASAPGYRPGNQILTVLDTDFPALTLNPNNPLLLEGESTSVTLRLQVPTPTPLEIEIQSLNPQQLLAPERVILDANQQEIEFFIQALDDDWVELDGEFSFSARATGWQDAQAQVVIIDNDRPELTFTLSRPTISENSDQATTIATLERSFLSNRPLKIQLTTDLPSHVSLPNTVEIPAQATAIQFPITALDDLLVEDIQTIQIQSTLLSPNGTFPVSQGPSVTLRILDNDGPHLTLISPSDLLGQGLSPATHLTLRRSAPILQALVVELTSSRSDAIDWPSSVTIPAGQNSVSFPLSTQSLPNQTGIQPVILSAAAPGWIPGETVLRIHDSPLPDLVIQNPTLPPSLTTESSFTLQYQITNQGSGTAQGPWTTRVYLSSDKAFGNDRLLTTQTFHNQLAGGQSIQQTHQLTAPLFPGQYWIFIQTDSTDQVLEALEDNNIQLHSTPVFIEPAYTAEVQTDTTVTATPSIIIYNGHAGFSNGTAAGKVPVTLHIFHQQTHRTLSAITDDNGEFHVSWQPLPGEAGRYEIAASHPGILNPQPQDSFILVGFSAEPPPNLLQLQEGASTTFTLAITNPGDTPLQGLEVGFESLPSSLTIEPDLPTTTLEGNQTTLLTLSVQVNNPTETLGTFFLLLTSREGATLRLPIPFRILPLVSKLTTTPPDLYAGMVRGQTTFLEFQISNEGSAPTGPITISLPDLPWLSSITPSPLPSLAPLQTARISLQLLPPEDLPLGPFTGSIALSSEHGIHRVPFEFRSLSDGRGSLRVTATDEFTFYAPGAPKVQNASVILRDAFNAEELVSGTTDSNGEFLLESLMEGHYEIEVRANQHSTFRSPIFIQGGRTLELETFLSRELVTYRWSVTPTEIEDRYDIIVEATFETVVPAPVVVVEPSYIDLNDLTSEVTQIDFNITNHGLIEAQEATFQFPSHPLWDVSPLVENLGNLAPRSTLTIPVLFRKRTPAPQRQSLSSNSPVDCGFAGGVTWTLICGKRKNSYSTGVQLANASIDCKGFPYTPYLPPGGGGPGGTFYFTPGPFIGKPQLCLDSCLPLAILGCVPGPIGCGASGLSCLGGLSDGVSSVDILDCLVGAAGCFIPPAAVPACIYSITRCLTSGPVASSSGGSGGGNPNWLQPFSNSRVRKQTTSLRLAAADPIQSYEPGIRAMLDLFNEMTGSPDGVWLNAAAGPQTGDWFQRFANASAQTSANGVEISANERVSLLSDPQPPGVPTADVARFLDRWNRTFQLWSENIFRPEQLPETDNRDFMDRALVLDLARQVAASNDLAQRAGYTDPLQAVVEGVRAQNLTEGADGVCAQVRLRIDQQASLTRQAFRATLELENASTTPLDQVEVEVLVRDENGDEVNELFGIRPPEVQGLPSVNGVDSLSPQTMATATWTLIPSPEAAPNQPRQFFIGGTLRYRQGLVPITIPLFPAVITVLPSPRLHVKYFHERNVYADDPFTDALEPSVPYNLAVLVENRGKGDAQNFRITSAQPKIIENEKGLLIDFKIIGTQVSGSEVSPSLEVNLGNIPGGETAVGRWLLTSSLQGLFIDYSASFEHRDALGNINLSLIEEVSIHEMIHLVEAPAPFADGKPDFLVNEIPDPSDLPDTLYLSDGSTHPVYRVPNDSLSLISETGAITYTLTLVPSDGWNYLQFPDPTEGDFRLVEVLRGDGNPIPLDNFWTTDRTFLGLSRRPRPEHLIHILDYNPTTPYTLIYDLNPERDTQAPTSQVQPLPDHSPTLIPVSWSGEDNPGGSGILQYDIYVSIDHGPYQRWLWNTRETSALYTGFPHHHYSFYSQAMDLAGNREPAPNNADTQTITSLINRTPQVTTPGIIRIAEGTPLQFQLQAEDPDFDELSFSFIGSAPAGLTLDEQTGLLQWITGEGLAGNIQFVEVLVLDNGTPRLGSVIPLQIQIQDQNNPPQWNSPLTLEFFEGISTSYTLQATDIDVPRQSLLFTLQGPAPEGLALNSQSGILTWRPTSEQGGNTYPLEVTVTDNGLPTQSTTTTFQLQVQDTVKSLHLQVATQVLRPGDEDSLPIHLRTQSNLRNLHFKLITDTQTLQSIAFTPAVPQSSLTALQRSETEWELELMLPEDQFITGEVLIGNIHLQVLPGIESTRIRFQPTELQAFTPEGIAYERYSTTAGNLYIIQNQPILIVQTGPDQTPRFLLLGNPGDKLILEGRNSLDNSQAWTPIQEITLEQNSLEFTLPLPNQSPYYLRTRKAP